MDNITAGLLVGLPLAMVFIVYMAVRGQPFVDLFRGDEELGKMPNQTVVLIVTGAMVLAAFGLGAVAGLIYAWVDSPTLFLALALGEAAIFSIVALITRTELAGDKILLNFAAAVLLGTLVPLFAG
jgi:hypothetical protein